MKVHSSIRRSQYKKEYEANEIFPLAGSVQLPSPANVSRPCCLRLATLIKTVPRHLSLPREGYGSFSFHMGGFTYSYFAGMFDIALMSEDD